MTCNTDQGFCVLGFRSILAVMSDSQNLPLSQTSLSSLPELDLSQETLNHVLGAVGMSSSGDV